MATDEYLLGTLHRLQALYVEMDKATGPIEFRNLGSHHAFRHLQRTESLVCYLKGVKALSTLYAAITLLKGGHAQEVNALMRMVDGFCDDIMFLNVPADGIEMGEDQKRFCGAFFSEEFGALPDRPLAFSQKRIAQASSGYVHGAYPQVMELFGGMPLRFHPQHMLGTPRIEEARRQIVHYVDRVCSVSLLVVRKLGTAHLEVPLLALAKEFSEQTSVKRAAPGAEALQAIPAAARQPFRDMADTL
jgi:hypothetical protein